MPITADFITIHHSPLTIHLLCSFFCYHQKPFPLSRHRFEYSGLKRSMIIFIIAEYVEYCKYVHFFCSSKRNEPKKKTAWVFSDPLTARFLSQTSRSSRHFNKLHVFVLLSRDSLLRLAFNGIFTEWVPRLKP